MSADKCFDCKTECDGPLCMDCTGRRVRAERLAQGKTEFVEDPDQLRRIDALLGANDLRAVAS